MMKPSGWPAPNDANAMVRIREPGGNVAPRIPAPAGERMAGPRPSKLIKIMNENDVWANETPSEMIAKAAVPTRKRVLRPRVSASPPATSKKTPFTRLVQVDRTVNGRGFTASYFDTTHEYMDTGHCRLAAEMPKSSATDGKAMVNAPDKNDPSRVTPETDVTIKVVFKLLRGAGTVVDCGSAIVVVVAKAETSEKDGMNAR